MTVSGSSDYYAILGFADAADRASITPEEIKKSYRKIAAENHPDTVDQQDKAAVAAATQKLQRINEAYEVLKDPELRERYDRFGDPKASDGGISAEWADIFTNRRGQVEDIIKAARAQNKQPDLSDVNFFLLNLDGMDLSGCKFGKAGEEKEVGAFFRNANLQGADFSGCKLDVAIFENANLENANLNGTTLFCCSFKDAKLKGAQLNDVKDVIGDILFDNAIMKKMEMQNAPLGFYHFKNVDVFVLFHLSFSPAHRCFRRFLSGKRFYFITSIKWIMS
ncbi:MAG: DnaJ domain-containing protein [Chryseobacterium sp.]